MACVTLLVSRAKRVIFPTRIELQLLRLRNCLLVEDLVLEEVFLVRMVVHHRDRLEITEDQDQRQYSECSGVAHANASSSTSSTIIEIPLFLREFRFYLLLEIQTRKLVKLVATRLSSKYDRKVLVENAASFAERVPRERKRRENSRIRVVEIHGRAKYLWKTRYMRSLGRKERRKRCFMHLDRSPGMFSDVIQIAKKKNRETINQRSLATMSFSTEATSRHHLLELPISPWEGKLYLNSILIARTFPARRSKIFHFRVRSVSYEHSSINVRGFKHLVLRNVC